MLCIPWRFFNTEEHFRLLNSLFRLCLIRPFHSSTSAWQPLQVSACWEQITATVFSAQGEPLVLSALTCCPSRLVLTASAKMCPSSTGWGAQKLNSAHVHVLAAKVDLHWMHQSIFVYCTEFWLQLWCPGKISDLPLMIHILQRYGMGSAAFGETYDLPVKLRELKLLSVHAHSVRICSCKCSSNSISGQQKHFRFFFSQHVCVLF